MTAPLIDQPHCPEGREEWWSRVYEEVETRGALPSASALDFEPKAQSRELKNLAQDYYSTLEREMRGLSRDEILKRLVEIELGDRTTAEKAERFERIEKKWDRLTQASAQSGTQSGATCESRPVPDPDPSEGGEVPGTLFERWKKTAPLEVYGAYKVLTVGYQSCSATLLPELRAGVKPVQGIRVVGRHPNGVGLRREVVRPDLVFSTHPYYAQRSGLEQCSPLRDSPMIYDYGGKPYTGSGTIDLGRDAGSGSEALGIDCSGFVASAVLTGGQRLKQGVRNKAVHSVGVSAAMFASPERNGLSCFEQISGLPHQTLLPGDLIANSGHIVMVEKVGRDPLGILSVLSPAGCSKLTVENFDFTILQSSPSLGGVGMNRYRAKDYLATSASMRVGVEHYARTLCQIRFGASEAKNPAQVDRAAIVRAKRTAECRETPIALAEESCFRECRSL